MKPYLSCASIFCTLVSVPTARGVTIAFFRPKEDYTGFRAVGIAIGVIILFLVLGFILGLSVFLHGEKPKVFSVIVTIINAIALVFLTVNIPG